MQIPFVNPVTSVVLFVQALLIYLRFEPSSGMSESHWGLVLIPVILAQFFFVAILASEALSEGGSKKRNDAGASEASETTLSYVLMEMMTGVMIILTTILYVFYLDDDTDLPLYWITSSFFGATIMFFIATVAMYHSSIEKAKCRDLDLIHRGDPYETIHQRGIRTVFVGVLVLSQGLFLWLYNSPWGRVMNTSLFWILVPSMILLVASFVVSVRQTQFRRSNPGPHLARQGSFVLTLLVLLATLILIVLEIDYGLIGNPKWIVLPGLILSVLLVVTSIYVYYQVKKAEKCAKEEEQTFPMNTTQWRPPPVYVPSPNDYDRFRYPPQHQVRYLGPPGMQRPTAPPQTNPQQQQQQTFIPSQFDPNPLIPHPYPPM